MSSLSQAIVNDLTAEDLQALAELLEPHLRQRPGASIKRADDGWLNSSAAAAYLGCSRDRFCMTCGSGVSWWGRRTDAH